jgi:hypothetical protein
MVFDSWQGQVFFSSQQPDQLLGPFSLSKSLLRAVCLAVKQPGHKADHSHPSSAKVKKDWSYTSIPPYILMAWCLIKHRDNFTTDGVTTEENCLHIH